MNALHDKIALHGAESLTDVELLGVVLDDQVMAEQALESCGSLSALVTEELSRLRMVGGMGLRRAAQLHAAVELGRRLSSRDVLVSAEVSNSSDAVRILEPHLRPLRHEECWVLYLTTANRVIECQHISRGGLQATVVDCRLIVKRALELLSTQIIVAHNHPSGSAEPSEADKSLTQRIREAASLFDIRLLDHIIIASSGEVTSFKSRGLL